jgi:hypothetical protein
MSNQYELIKENDEDSIKLSSTNATNCVRSSDKET